MSKLKSFLYRTAASASVAATYALSCLPAHAAQTITGAGGVNATVVQANVVAVLPYVTFIALILTICVVVWLPRYMGLAMTSLAMLVLGNFASPIVNLLYGNNNAVAAGAELFPHQVLPTLISANSAKVSFVVVR